jgi:hypothetical protein
MRRALLFLAFGLGCGHPSNDQSGDDLPATPAQHVPAGRLACSSGSASQLGAPVSIEPTPCLSVGALDGDPMVELDRVVTPFLLPDGSLAVPTIGASSIRIFAPDGAFVRSLGGPGEGPGEFSYLAAAWPRGDTIEAFDLYQQRLIRFFPSDSAETIPLREARQSAVYGMLGEGWATMVLAANMGGRDEMTVRAMSRNRTLMRDTLTLLEVAITDGMHREETPGISGPHPLTPTALVAVHDGQIYVGETLTPLLSVYAADGRLLRQIPVPLQAPRGGADLLRQVVDSVVTLAEEGQQTATRERWGSYRVPDRLSVFWALVVDELGFVWVRPYDPIAHALALGGLPSNRGGPGGRWLVLDPGGVEVGWIDVPDGFEPLSITADAVVGMHRDELDVESVRVHRLRRRF